MSVEPEDPGCSMAGRAHPGLGGYGADGHCPVRNKPCARACTLASLQSELGAGHNTLRMYRERNVLLERLHREARALYETGCLGEGYCSAHPELGTSHSPRCPRSLHDALYALQPEPQTKPERCNDSSSDWSPAPGQMVTRHLPETTIVCVECRTREGENLSFHEAYHAFRRMGWRRRRGEWRCPDCSEHRP